MTATQGMCRTEDCKTSHDCTASPLRFSRLDLLLDFPRAYHFPILLKYVQIGLLSLVGLGKSLNATIQVKCKGKGLSGQVVSTRFPLSLGTLPSARWKPACAQAKLSLEVGT